MQAYEVSYAFHKKLSKTYLIWKRSKERGIKPTKWDLSFRENIFLYTQCSFKFALHFAPIPLGARYPSIAFAIEL